MTKVYLFGATPSPASQIEEREKKSFRKERSTTSDIRQTFPYLQCIVNPSHEGDVNRIEELL